MDLPGPPATRSIEGAVLQGIPVKSLPLSVKGEGDDLQYEQAKDKAALLRLAP